MNLQHLRYLVAFSDHRTLTDAAQSMGISQPAISRALHELQEELGCALFQRCGRKLQLTDVGLTVLAAARRSLAAVEDIHRMTASAEAEELLRIATFQSMAAGMSAMLEQFIRVRPGVRVQVVHTSHEEEMIAMLRRRDIDLGYGALGKAPHGLAITATRPLQILLASPPGTRLPPAVTLHDLDGLPMICPPLTEERRRLLDRPCEQVGAKPRIVLESADSTTFLSSIQSGIGSSVIWDVMAEQSAGVEVRRFDPPRQIAVCFVHHPKPASLARQLLSIAERSAGAETRVP